MAEQTEERFERLTSAVSRMRTRGGFDLGRAQLYVGAGLVVIGFLTIILGWWAAARTPFLFEQIPYLMSGGLLGVALCFIGGFLYFAHWISRLLDEQRTQTERTHELLTSLIEGSSNGRARESGRRRKRSSR